MPSLYIVHSVSHMLLASLPHSGIINYHFSREHHHLKLFGSLISYSVLSKFLFNRNELFLCGRWRLDKVRKTIAKKIVLCVCIYLSLPLNLHHFLSQSGDQDWTKNIQRAPLSHSFGHRIHSSQPPASSNCIPSHAK